ncbi:hypothetical protein TNCV_1127381 [Trichonephila clavipes]|nr:hypothetical protein TNCV_1127381 [Trichonephila clavipes]
MADLLPRNRVVQKQPLSEETPAKPLLVCVRLRHDDAGRHWETEREAFLHPISRLRMWPDVGGPAWERVS